jgi:hypothetical protein
MSTNAIVPQNSPFAGKRWIELFEAFVSELRIDTKELVERDSRGSFFDLWRSQRMYLEELAAGLESGQRSFCFLKSRQCGVTTISLAIDVFWLAMFPGTRGALVTDSDANRSKFRIILKNYIASFPRSFFGSSFGIKKGKDNKDFIHFTNGSTLDFLVAGKKKNETLGEGSGYSFMHSTETANYGSPKGLQSFRETLSDTNPLRLYIYESTAKGHNHWKTIYEEHLRDTVTKRAAFIGWWAKDLNTLRRTGPAPEPRLFHIYGSQPPSPEEREKMKLVLQRHGVQITQEQLAWYRWRQSDESSTDDDLEQNQPWYDGEAFVLSGYSFFHARTLAKDLERISNQLTTLPDGTTRRGVLYEGYRFLLSNQFLESRMESVLRDKTLVELRVWEHPEPLGVYAIGVDPAWGRDGQGDNAVISVWRGYADCLVQTAEYAANMHDTRQVAWVLAYLAGAYRNCHINIEISGGVGLAVMSEFKSLRNQLQMRYLDDEGNKRREQDWSDFLANARWFLYRKYDSVMSGSNTTQFNTTRDLKWAILNQLRDTRNKDELIINSKPFTEELLAVVQDNDSGGLGAPAGAHDDRVMAAALANRTWIDMLRPSLVAQGATYAAIQSGQFYDEDAEPGMKSFIGKLVTGHFKRAEELDEVQREENYAPKWLRDRGLA